MIVERGGRREGVAFRSRVIVLGRIRLEKDGTRTGMDFMLTD